MNVIELQIGDYVDYRGQTIKVTSLYDKGGSNEVGWGRKEDTWVNADNIKPIPLTPEILEKNGWVYNNEDEKFFPQTWVGGGLMLQGADDCGYCIVVTSDYDDEDTNVTPFIILYVHELQHALRLRRIKKEIKL